MSSAKSSTLPTLQGQRIKTRKRDEKEKHDPAAFRDSLLTGFQDILSGGGTKTGSTQASPESEPLPPVPVDEVNGQGSPTSLVTKTRLDALSKFLDDRGSKKDTQDYRKYGEVLFDVLIAGGILAPGGNIIDPEVGRTEFCVFKTEDPELIKGFGQGIVKLIRRFKYLEKTLEDEFKKILKFLKGFSPEERKRLAVLTAYLLSVGQVPGSILTSAIYDQGVKDGCSGTFIINVLQAWLQEKDSSAVWSSMKKAGLDQRIFEFFPTSKRTPENLEKTFEAEGLGQLLIYQKAGMGDRAKRELQSRLTELMKESARVEDLISVTKDAALKNKMVDHEVVVLLWNTVMNNIEWSKKEELVAEQALKHIRIYCPLLEKFTSTAKAEITLMNRVQEFCFENMNFLKVFCKIIQLLYKADVISEDAVFKWYKEAHSTKGKSIFLEDTRKFVEWLQQAEEESEDEN